MKAITYSRYGGPAVTQMTEVPRPQPGPGEILIRTAAAGLNPVDALQREGRLKMVTRYTFPLVGGNELTGWVEQLGSGVQGFNPGDRVMTRVDKNELGALAEYVRVRAEFVAPAPESTTLRDAAAIPLAGLTALQALGPAHLNVQPGDRLLVTAGAGGVGLLAIQLAKLMGAQVTTTASPAGEGLVRQAGADVVINYRERSISDGEERFTKVLDLVGGETLNDLMANVERGARIVSVSGPPTRGTIESGLSGLRGRLVHLLLPLVSRRVRKLAATKGASYEFLFMRPDGEGLRHLAGLVDQGKLFLAVDSRFPLDDFAAAFERLESRRSKGKVIIDFPG